MEGWGVCHGQGHTSGFDDLFVLEYQMLRRDCAHTLVSSCPLVLSWRDVPPSTRTSVQRYVSNITAAWLYLWASAAGNRLGDAMGMAQEVQCLYFPVSHRPWGFDSHREIIERVAATCQIRQR